MQDESSQSPYANLAKKIRGGKSASTIEFENRAPQITVVRGQDESASRGLLGIFNLFGGAVALLSFQIQFDGENVGILKQGNRITFNVSPGEHTIRINTSLVASDSKFFSAENGQKIKSTCQSKLTGIILQEI